MFFNQAAILSFISALPTFINARAYPGQDQDQQDPNQRPYAQDPSAYIMQQADQQVIVDAHNVKRSLHVDTGSLTWNNTLAEYAQQFIASYDCASGELHHSGGDYGENIAIGLSTEGTVHGWYGEIKDYNYSNPGFTEAAGHFTQLVWKDSQQVGCAIRYCNSYWGNLIICEYDPSGNYLGEFQDNVMPLINTSPVAKRDIKEEDVTAASTTTLAPANESSVAIETATTQATVSSATAATSTVASISSFEGAASNLEVVKLGVFAMIAIALL